VDQNKNFLKLKEILISNTIIIKEMILTLCYELALKAFHFFISVDVMQFHTAVSHLLCV